MPTLRSPSRQQLAAYSPLSGGAVSRALRRSSQREDVTTSRLRSLLADRYAADRVVLTDSGTSALQLAIRIATAAAATARVPIALPAFTCFEVASAAVGADVPVVLYDIAPQTLAPDPASLEHALAVGARVVVVSALFGIPLDWDAVARQLAPYEAIAIEDAAQGHGASWRGRTLGSHGPLSIVSFGRGKGWTASGGGALFVRGELAGHPRTQRILAEHVEPSSGAAPRIVSAMAQWTLGRPSLYALPASIPSLGLGRTIYHPPHVPRTMDRFTSALLLETFDAARREALMRSEAGRRWCERIRTSGGIARIALPPDGSPGYLRFPVRIHRGNERVADNHRARRVGIATTYPTTLGALAPLRARLAGPPLRCPGAALLTRDLVTLPTHSLVSSEDVEAVLAVLSELEERS